MVAQLVKNLPAMQETQVQSLGQEDLLEDEMATCSSIGLKLNIQKTKIMEPSPITSWKIDWETMVTLTDFILGAPESLQMVTAVMKLKDSSSWKESYDQPRQHIKKQRHYFANKGPSSQSSSFSVVING